LGKNQLLQGIFVCYQYPKHVAVQKL
jgi:hypothetical protein